MTSLTVLLFKLIQCFDILNAQATNISHIEQLLSLTSSQKKGGDGRRLCIFTDLDSQFNQANVCHFFLPFLYSFYFYYLLTFIGNWKTLHRNFIFHSKSHLIEVGFGFAMFNSRPLIFRFPFFQLFFLETIFSNRTSYTNLNLKYIHTQ